MTITLLNVRSPKWYTCDTPKVDSGGNIVNDSDGNPIMVPELDASGNPVKSHGIILWRLLMTQKNMVEIYMPLWLMATTEQ